MSKIYVASSWRNNTQPIVVELCRELGHEVYDFKSPVPNTGFSWREISPDWENWSTDEYITALDHPAAVAGFNSDFEAMHWADTFILVLPCGRSAHLELGWAAGKGKRTIILLEKMEPELMVKMCDHICPDTDSLKVLMAKDYLSNGFVFITSDGKPMFYDRKSKWLSYWHEGQKSWVTHSDTSRQDISELESHKIPDDQAELYHKQHRDFMGSGWGK